MLSKADILGADDRKTKTVDVPEWGGSVTIKTMSGEARDRWEQFILGSDGTKENIRAQFAAAIIVDENGDQMFSAADVAALGKKSGAALDRIFSAGQELNRLSDEDVEELAKN